MPAEYSIKDMQSNSKFYQFHLSIIKVYKKCQKKFKTIPDLLFRDDMNAGPTALDGLLIFLHFKMMENAPTKTSKSTKEDEAMMIMVLRFIR